MPATDCDIFVYTFKAGALSRMAHDLRLRSTDHQVQIDADGPAYQIEAEVRAKGLVVDGVMRDAQLHADVLSKRDLRSIERSVQTDVLHSDRYPSIAFVGDATKDGQVATLRGELDLHGQRRPCELLARTIDARVWSAELDIHQPDFGIKPYTAMLGTLRIEPLVRVEIRCNLNL